MKKSVFMLIFFYNAIEAKNAGILPYAVKENGKVLFLLGREAGGGAQGTWADFGGGGKPEDGGDTEKTAIREFTEETRAAFAQTVDSKYADPTLYKKAIEQSNQVIRHHMSRGIDNPGPKTFYTLYLAKVDYLSPNIIKHGPYRHHEKDAYEWVDAETFINNLQRQNKYLKKYYQSKTGKFKPGFGDKFIRRPFATYFIDPTTGNKIRSFIGLPLRKISFEKEGRVPMKKKSEEEEEEWIPTPPRKQPANIEPFKVERNLESGKRLKNNLKKLISKLHELNELLS